MGYVIGGFVFAALFCVATGAKLSADHRRRKRAVAAHIAAPMPPDNRHAQAIPDLARTNEGSTNLLMATQDGGEEAGGVWGDIGVGNQ